MVDQNLQNRAGKNTRVNPSLLYGADKGSGELMKIAANQDNVLSEGQRGKVRIVGAIPNCSLGRLYNRNGDGVAVDYDLLFIDPQGNEVVYASGSVNNGNDVPVAGPNCIRCSPFALIEDEQLVLRVTGGDPSLADGVTFIPLPTHDGVTLVAPRSYISDTTRTIIAQPPTGKIWQMPMTQLYPCGASIQGWNFDAVNPHDFDCYLVNSATSDEVLLSASDSVATASVENLFSDMISSHMIPYPYRLEVEAVDANPFDAAFLITSFFVEFDLPKDIT